MDDRTEQAPRTGAPRWMRWLLVASLALNLLVVGVVAGYAIKGGPDGRKGPPGSMGAMHRALSDAERDDLKSRMIREFRDRKDERTAVRREMDALVVLLRAEPFDTAAATERMAQVRALFGGRVASAQDLLIAYWSEMSLEDRAAYADRLEQELQRRRR
ncbi:periplasmic heavy metal sensor [Roseovarius sp. B08]|uniref:periplasmic heavy metal sensor n=1 Tax=Roseovarius sp. B08 TaxID=3449223 RepID=UPI003EDB7948